MRGFRRTSLGVAAALPLCLVGCKKKDPVAPAAPATKPAEVARQDTAFSPPEIRRDRTAADTAPLVAPLDTTKPAPAPVAEKTTTPPPPPPPPPTPQKPAPVATPPKPEPVVAKAPKAAEEPKKAKTGNATPPGSEGEWVLQINIYKSEAEAKSHVAKLAAEGIPAYALPVPTGGTGLSGNYWRVRVGRFTTRAQAQAWGDAEIAPRGMKFWVDKKSNENKGTP